MPRFQ